LQGCGYRRVGLYTSPHLVSFRERIRVDGIPLPMTSVRDFIRHNGPFCDSIGATYFEIATAMALAYFREQRCEAVVLETGLGGRLDATNAVMPKVSVITPVDIDHVEQLGPTLAGIFAEKAAILKPGIPMVVAKQADGLVDSLLRQAEGVGSPVIQAEKHAWASPQGAAGTWTFSGTVRSWSFSALCRPEAYQRDNLVLACLALEAFAGDNVQGLTDPERWLGSALPSGRLQRLQRPDRLPLWLDGAHNPHGLKALVRSLRESRPDFRWLILFGMMADKAVHEALALLQGLHGEVRWFPLWDKYPRAYNPGKVENPAPFAVFPLEGESLRHALDATRPENAWDGVLVCGSLYLLGEVIALICDDYPELAEFKELAEDRRWIS
jgi:dihydrofolate synthase / folylpolyglutamate synthase